jgi:hypothetical protein
MEEPFAEDPKIQQIAEAYALDAIDFAAEHFRRTLDWSDASVAHIEAIMGSLHRDLARANPSDKQVIQFARMFGSYVGEVFRRNHGAAWGIVTLGGQSFPGLRASKQGALFWPWGRAQNRLRNGAEDNVWHYYQTLVEDDG